MGGGNLRSGPHGQNLGRRADFQSIAFRSAAGTMFGVIQYGVACRVASANDSICAAVQITGLAAISGMDAGACVAVIRAGGRVAAVASDSGDADRRACFNRSGIQTMIDIIIRILGAAADAAGISTHI